MKRILIVAAYEGTAYCGWQIQKNGTTVEEVINRELCKLLKEDIQIIGASRTDSGVHALGNVAVFDTNARIPGDKISYALNQGLPEDIRIQFSAEVKDDFHPRHCSSKKTYEYSIWNHRFQNPICRNFSHFYHMPLDIDRMNTAAKYLVGRHDFKSFCSVHTQAESTIREIYSLTVDKQEEMIRICVKGNGFLYNMVRIIAGTLIQVGAGSCSPERIPYMIDGKDRSLAGPTAPAKGLTLVKIEYPDEVYRKS